MKVVVAGQGAFGQKHLDGIARIDGVEVASLVGGNQESTKAVAAKYGIPHYTGDLAEALAQPGVEAAILATPTQMHAKQGEAVMRAGKHVEIEIPVSDTLAQAERLLAVQKETGVIGMGGHTRRFNPSHQYIHNKIKAGELKVLQMDVQTYFFRRTNMNAAGQARSWTDHLLWHHACHTVDLFQYQTGGTATVAHAIEGPMDPNLKISMDMGILMKVPSGAICTLSLSFNNDGPFGTFFRYICDNGTYLAYYDDLSDGKGNKIDLTGVAVSFDGIELQDREFFSAIKEKREPNASFAQILPAMQTLDKLDKDMGKLYTPRVIVADTPYGMPPYVIERVMAKRGRLAVFERFDPLKTALLCIDMQYFYVGEIPSVLAIIPNINRIAKRLRALGGLIVWVGMSAGENGESRWHVYHDNFFTPERGANHRDGLSPGHPAHAFHADLDIDPHDEIVYKSRFSPFIAGASNIQDVLQPHGIENLIVVGTATNMCCESAARDAMMLDYKVVMVADANGARYDDDHLAGLTSFYQSFGDVRTTAEVTDSLLVSS